MCEHTRRPKVFCINESCSIQPVVACNICLKATHTHSIQNFMDERQIMYLLTRFDPPSAFKQERKGPTLKMYKFLSRLKAQITNKFEEMMVELMSKIKYPYLYSSQLLECYRNIRDKNYLRLSSHKFKFFCKTAKNLSGIDFLDKQKEYYNRYLQDSLDSLKDFGEKIKIIETTFGFHLPNQVMQLHQQFINEAKTFQKTHKVSKSLEKHDYQSMKPRDNLNGSMKIEKKAFQYLTPTKQTLSFDVSLDNLPSYRSSDNKSWRGGSTYGYNDTKQNEIDSKSAMKRVNTAGQGESESLKVQNEDQAKTVKSTDEKKVRVKSSASGVIAKYTNFDFEDYEKQFENTFKIKVSDVSRSDSMKKQSQKDKSQTDSIELKSSTLRDSSSKKNNYNDLMDFSIKDRQQKIKSKVEQMQKERLQNRQKLSLRDNEKSKRQYEGNIKKNIQNKKDNSSLTSSPVLEKKSSSRKQALSPSKRPDVSLAEAKKQIKQNSFMNSYLSRRSPKKSPEKANLNVSLNKQFMMFEPEKVQETVHEVFKNATKQIPLIQKPKEESPRKLRLKKRNSIQQIQDQQLKASCLLIAQLQAIKTIEKKCIFLEKYIDRYEDSLSAVEYLSYLYLQQAKPKECLTLTTQYLQKLDNLNIKQSVKINLKINKAAALNSLGRYSQTVSFLTTKIDYLDSDKLHKCMGDALFNLGMIDRAIYHYQTATKLNDKYDQAYYNLAVILYLQESYFNAKMNIDKAIRWQANNPTYLELLSAIKERINSNPAQS